MNPAIVVEWGLRGAVPAVIVSAVLVLLRVRDIALEQRLWRSALVFACVVPAVTIVIATARAIATPAETEAMAMQALQAAGREGVAAMADAVSAHSSSVSFTTIATLTWLAGTVALLLRIVGAWRLVRSGTPASLHVATDATVRVCPALTSPATIGSTILVPAAFEAWAPASRAAVLAHEGSHVSHRDFWWQLLARTYVACFWWNPAAWLLSFRLRWLAERRSDAAALAVMPDRGAYAALLLEVAQRARAANAMRMPAFRVAMARPSMLRQRIDAVMQAAEGARLRGLARVVALVAPAAGAMATAIVPMPGAELTRVTARALIPAAELASAANDSVTIRLYAATTVDARAEAVIARSSNPDSVREAYSFARSDRRVRWFALRPDGSEAASGETPATFVMPASPPFAITYCAADAATQLLIEYRFTNKGGGKATGACTRIFRQDRMTGSQGVERPRGR